MRIHHHEPFTLIIERLIPSQILNIMRLFMERHGTYPTGAIYTQATKVERAFYIDPSTGSVYLYAFGAHHSTGVVLGTLPLLTAA